MQTADSRFESLKQSNHQGGKTLDGRGGGGGGDDSMAQQPSFVNSMITEPKSLLNDLMSPQQRPVGLNLIQENQNSQWQQLRAKNFVPGKKVIKQKALVGSHRKAAGNAKPMNENNKNKNNFSLMDDLDGMAGTPFKGLNPIDAPVAMGARQSQPFSLGEIKQVPKSRYPRANHHTIANAMTSVTTNNTARPKHAGHSQEHFNKFSLIDKQEVMRTSGQDRLSDYNNNYAYGSGGKLRYPGFSSNNYNYQKTKLNSIRNNITTSPDQQQNARTALCHIQEYQNQRMKKLQKDFSQSIKQVESHQAQEAALSAEIQELIIQKRGMGLNIQKNMFKSSKAPALTSDESSSPLLQTSVQQKYLRGARNDYHSFMKENQDSISALNTLKSKHKRTSVDHLDRKDSIALPHTLLGTECVTTGSGHRETDSPARSLHDSIMSHEFDLQRVKDGLPSRNYHDHALCIFKDQDSTQSRLILEQMIEAQKASNYNQPKVERLIQIDYVMNNINNRFKSRILNKFSHDYVKKHLGSEQSLDSQAGWIARDIQQNTAKKLSKIVKDIEHRKGMDLAAKGQSIAEKYAQISKGPWDSTGKKEDPNTMRVKNSNMEDFKAANQFMREMDKKDEDFKQPISSKLNKLDVEGFEAQRDGQKSRIPPELRLQTLSTCNELDRIIEQKKVAAGQNTRLLRAFIDGDLEAQKSDDEVLENKETSALEKKRRRIMNQFEQEIKKKKQMLQDVQYYMESNLDPNVKAQRILQGLEGKDRDPEVNQAFLEIEPHTARFLADLLGDVMNQTQKKKMLQNLSKQLQLLVDKKEAFDRKMKEKIRLKITQEDVVNRLSLGLKELNIQAIRHMAKQEAQGFKEQFVFVRKETPDEKDKNRLGDLVKKNFSKITGKIGMGFMTKIVNMLQQFDKIFKDGGNLGTFYDKMDRSNLWENDFMRNNDMEIDFLESQKAQQDVNNLYTAEVQTSRFYMDIKLEKPHLLDENNTNDAEKLANLKFMNKIESSQQAPLPTFARILKNQLFLNELRFTDEMAQGLSDYLLAVKGYPSKITKTLCIDNCNMKDGQFAQILKGVQSQGTHLQTLIYSSGELSQDSTDAMINLIPHIRNLHLNNVSKCNIQTYHKIIDQISEKGRQIQKLKLSNTNLNDAELVQKICQIIDVRYTLIHIDLSWAKLSPRFLNQIMQTLYEDDTQTLKNLNLSYNSLVQPPLDQNLTFNAENPELAASRDFVQNLCEFLKKNELLNHLDVSGMNFSKQQILMVAEAALCQSESLLAVHLSDNGIRFDTDTRDEILDMMGLTSSIFKSSADEAFTTNQRILQPIGFKKVIRKHMMSLKSNDMQNTAESDASIYTNRLLHTKQGKAVMNKMNQHKVQTNGGVGRLESNLVDQFILSRQVNHAELVFNQQPYLDKYWELDAAEQWRLQDTACGISGGCPICNKHRYTMIFYEQDQNDPLSQNEGLIEITDPQQVQKIQEDLNISFRYDHEIAPIILGSVVTGGFKRKLRMMRADYFSVLSVAQSIHTVESLTQVKAIKRGLMANLTKSQNLGEDDQHLQFLKGWQRKLIVDKALRNEVTDVMVVNFPPALRPAAPPDFATLDGTVSVESPLTKAEDFQPDEKPCSTFIYAAYLPPGPHQFLIFCPKTKRAFCKDIVVDLNDCEPCPELPEPYRPPNKAKRPTRQNVWRQWKVDDFDSNNLAFINDCKRTDYTALVKDPEQLIKCQTLLLEKFEMLQIVFMEFIANAHSAYPRISYDVLWNRMLAQQRTDDEKKRLQRSQIELAFLGATRVDSVKGLSGTLCRGQFIEIIVRLSLQRNTSKSVASEALESFLEGYIKPQFEASNILKIRAELRESKQLNQLLFDNKHGLIEIWAAYKLQPRGFTYQSAVNLFAPMESDVADLSDVHFIPDMQKVFCYSQMTEIKDREEKQHYEQLYYVEFLDFICRVAIERRKKLDQPPAPIHDVVFELLKVIWQFRGANRNRYPPVVHKDGDILEEWPELAPVMELDLEDGQ